MYLLLALGLLIYIMVVRGTEKSNKKTSDREFKERNESQQHDFDIFFKTYVAPDDMEEHIRNKVFSDDHDVQLMRDRILSEANVNATYDMLILALLAQECKISRRFIWGGFDTTAKSNSCENPKPYAEVERRFMIWYDKELRKHGMQEELLFVPDSIDSRPHSGVFRFAAGYHDIAKPVVEAGDVVRGRYMWFSMRGKCLGGRIIDVQL